MYPGELYRPGLPSIPPASCRVSALRRRPWRHGRIQECVRWLWRRHSAHLHRSRPGGAQHNGFIYGCIRGFDYKAIEFWLRSGVDNWFFRHAVRWLVPRRFLDGAAFESLSHQLSNFLTTQGNEVAVLFPVKLRTKIKPVNSRIISIHNQKVLWFLEQLSPFHELSLLRSQRNPQFVSGLPDNGGRLEQDDPILCLGVVLVDWNESSL